MQISLENWGTVNKNAVTLRKESKTGNSVSLCLVFSYKTCVHVTLMGAGEYLEATHANDWSTTTGKLLNELQSDKSKRIKAEDFAVVLEKAVKLFEQA